MIRDTLSLLAFEKKGPCLSVIIPMNKLSRERMQNPEVYRKAISKAKSVVNRRDIPDSVKKTMLEKLNELTEQFKPAYTLYGIGLFVSPSLAEGIEFPFTVKEKIILDKTFETRDLHYLQQFTSPYYVLVLGKNRLHLYSVTMDHFMEIKDGHFPMEYHEEYEYERSHIGTSYGYASKGFEKDKNSLNAIRLQSFYKEAAQQVDSYIHKTGLPLIITGTQKQLTEFKTHPVLHGKISGEVKGSFTDKNFFDLRTKAWLSYTKFKKQEVDMKIKEFVERDKLGYLSKGVQEVWTAAHEGKGLWLLVEKDYSRPTYLRDHDPVLYTRPPQGKYTLVPDAVDDIIETVLEKGGKVMFTEDKKLSRFDNIALLHRY
jgi:hypothetical protein